MPRFLKSISTIAFTLTGGTPGVGKVLTSDADGNATWETPSGGGGNTFTASATPPSSPSAGDGWLDTDNGIEYTYVNDGNSSQWVELGPTSNIGPAGPTGPTGPTGPEGGTSTLTTKGDLLTRDSSAVARLAVGTNRFALVADSAQTLGVKWDNPYQQQLNAQSGATYTFALTDAYGTTVQFTSASAVTATIPTNSSVAFPIGSVINLIQWAAGTVTVQGASGVTLVGDGSKFKTNAQYSVASLVKMDTNTWAMFGQVKA